MTTRPRIEVYVNLADGVVREGNGHLNSKPPDE